MKYSKCLRQTSANLSLISSLNWKGSFSLNFVLDRYSNSKFSSLMKLPFDEIWACSSTTWYGTGTISSSNLFHDYQDAIYGQIQNFQTPWNSNLIKSRRLDFALHKLYLTWLGDFVDCDCKSRWISKFLFLPSYLSMHVVFSQSLGKLHENKDLKQH